MLMVKTTDESDPVLTFAITNGFLFSNDVITGALSRVTGENVGTYDITIGIAYMQVLIIISHLFRLILHQPLWPWNPCCQADTELCPETF